MLKIVVGILARKRVVGFFFGLLLCSLSFGQSYRVSELKFENFKTYDQYGISLETVRGVLLAFGKANPTFEQSGLFKLAGNLAKVYHDQGLVFHRVEVVLGSPTRLVLVPGVMAGVDIRNNQRYRTEQLAPFFDDQFGKLVDSNVMQAAMLQMNALPGLEGFAYLSFGSFPGDAVMNINVSQESWGQLTTRLNNYGSAATGEYRLNTQLTLNNPLHLSEQWRLGASLSDEYENWSATAAVDFYRGARHRFGLATAFQHLALTQSFALLDMTGWQGSADLTYQFSPSTRYSRTFAIELGVGYLQQQLSNTANISGLDIALMDVPASLAVTGNFATSKQYLGYGATLKGGWLADYQAPVLLTDDYWAVIQPELSFARSFTGGSLQRGIDFKTRMVGQYALTPLPSHRRFALTGPTKVASYPVGGQSQDSAVMAEAGLSLFNFTLGPVQSALQSLGQVGWGQTGDHQSDLLTGIGAVLDINVGPFKTQNKVFTDETFNRFTWWFEVTLDWPKGQ